MSIHSAVATLILWAAFVSTAPADPPPKAKPDERKRKADPKAAEEFVKRGIANVLKDDFDKAIEDFTAALRLDPKNVEVLRYRALAYYENREYAKSVADHKKTIEIDPKDPVAHYCLAELLAHAPDPKLRDGKKAVEHAKKACELDQWKVGTTVALLAAAHAETGAFEEAVNYQKKAIEVFKAEGDPDLSEKETRLKLYETLEGLSRAIKADPTNPEGYRRRGQAYLENGIAYKAVADFSEAIKLNPKSGEFFIERGQAYLALGRAYGVRTELEKAISDFTEAVRLDPKDRSAIALLANTYYEIGEYSQAAQVNSKEIEKDPNNGVALSDLARILAVCPDPKVRDGKKAVEYAKKACETYEWKVPMPIEVLAAAHAEAGAFDEAIKYQANAIDCMEANRFAPLDNTLGRLKLYEAKKPVRCKSLFSDW